MGRGVEEAPAAGPVGIDREKEVDVSDDEEDEEDASNDGRLFCPINGVEGRLGVALPPLTTALATATVPAAVPAAAPEVEVEVELRTVAGSDHTYIPVGSGSSTAVATNERLSYISNSSGRARVFVDPGPELEIKLLDPRKRMVWRVVG